MGKVGPFIVLSILLMSLVSFLSKKFSTQNMQEVSGSIYDFKMKNLEGEVISFAQFRGKILMIVNTASKCGYTPQYADMQKLHEKYKDDVVVLGFPANNFLWQEPGTNDEIAAFCKENYGVTFQMFEKISVKGGDKHPLYKWLEVKSGESPSWNFCKYVVDAKGDVVGFYSAKVNPLAKEITKHFDKK
jgi:glutathione peroxidase